MELILNELSFDGQFKSYDDFIDYIRDTLAPLLDIVIENKIPLLKKSDIYDRLITKDRTMADFLRMSNDPVISLMKNYIVNLAYHEPYWDNEIMTCHDVNYEYQVVEDEPNCFTEVIERQGKLISLRHPAYYSERIACKRNNKELEISNIVKVEQFLKEYLLENRKRIRYILERYPYGRAVTCVESDGKCYAEEDLLKNDLETDDLINIIDSIPRLIEDLEHGRKSDLWDKLQDDIFELRLHVSANRIFRLLFVQQKGLHFLNGFIKKRQKTPPAEIAKAIRIKNQVWR